MTDIKEQNRFLPPMRMHPAYRHGDMTPWGGEQLKTVFGKDIPDERTGEALEMSVIPGLESTDDDGVTLTALIERYGSRLTGLPEGTEFPLLLKLLAAKGTLSVQVHPDDEYAKAHENKLGKTEAWVILHAEEGASLLYGIREGVTIDDLRRALTGGEDVEPLIQRIPVKAGDVFYMPAGMVHAIGGGILLYEIQQSSDVTYRLWDFNRVNDKGEKRPLAHPAIAGCDPSRAERPAGPYAGASRAGDHPSFGRTGLYAGLRRGGRRVHPACGGYLPCADRAGAADPALAGGRNGAEPRGHGAAARRLS